MTESNQYISVDLETHIEKKVFTKKQHSFTMEDYDIEIVHSPEDLDEIYKLRVTSWGKTLFFNPEDFPNGYYDDFDLDGIQFALRYRNRIVAAGRFNIFNHDNRCPLSAIWNYLPNNESIGFFSRLVVIPKLQGNGISKMIDEARYEYGLSNGLDYFVACVKMWRIRSLQKRSFRVLSRIDDTNLGKWLMGAYYDPTAHVFILSR